MISKPEEGSFRGTALQHFATLLALGPFFSPVPAPKLSSVFLFVKKDRENLRSWSEHLSEGRHKGFKGCPMEVP